MRYNLFYKGISNLFSDWKHIYPNKLRAELGQAQLKPELGFTSTYLHQIDEQESLIVLC